ncbi:hypothetical protein IW140_000459 [Coemansia sp. RSA 1813]|nr:hypothetical protein EV178_000582 [Coemansia sp. RSA 1646]KAJ1771228.1 hypothetical protein LPJ74_002496 [Coemansia sp. RSA 1843]KAJ2092797.1 hypothetical protein IW138_000892 [Coemansia sp. RSA 986]KAJ2217703.1 hypothetical protein EV179_000188 [Coemansia sp. RSA 487]KAJ2573060.1 hypothetical protein IW140_000459 [Coemansia sp. RSA 1813]
MAESIITSVTQQTAFPRPHGDSVSDFLPSQITLNVRGRHFVIDRETLNHLPDSLLNTMFPNGMHHIGRSGYGYGAGDYPYYRSDSDEESGPTWVDFDPDMLEYVLRTYGETLECDLLASSKASQQNSDGARLPEGASAEQKADNGNDEGDEPRPNRNGDGAGSQGAESGQSKTSTGRDGSGAQEDGGNPSSASEDAPGWLNYASDGKANLVVGSSTGDKAPAPASANTSAPASGEAKNDSLSAFTDTGSHVNNSSSGATQSTSSSAVLNYMRFVADAASHANSNPQARAEPQMPVETGVVYYDRNPLVVLREELDYFVVPSSGRTKGDISDVESFTLNMAKTRCGELLVEDDSVFEPLERTMQRNLEKWRNKINTEGASDEAQALQSASVIEQQLIDMLCLAGFPRDARWGCRRTEPSRTSVTSLLTVPLDESADQSRMIAAQKLLLFYKKPARKCWWEGEDVNAGDNEHKIDLKLWCRRTWTLELVLI